MPLPQKKLIPGLLLALVIAALAAPPLWWSAGAPPVIAPGAPENNHAPANIGQAKHMAKSALDALRPVLPAVADQIEADLVGPGKPIPTWAAPANQTETDKNHAPLLIGQLKAIADPFYTRLHAAAPTWLEAERTASGTDHPGSIFPWTSATTDDNNKGVANIGQLKAAFSLRFDTLTTFDYDGDGLADLWEIINGLNPTDPADANADPDGDGIPNHMELALGTDPNSFNQIGPVNLGFSEEITDSPDLSFRPENPSDLYPEDSVPHWNAAIGQHIEIWDEGDGNPYAELQSHWDAKGIEQEFDMLPGTSLTFILRYRGRYDGYNDSNAFTLKIAGAHEVRVNGQAAETQDSLKLKSFMTEEDWEEYADWHYASVSITTDPNTTTLVPIILTLIPADTDEAITYGGFVDFLPVEIKQVSFDGNNYHELRSDDNITIYDAPQWVDINGDGIASSKGYIGEKNYPIAFTRKTTPQIKAKFRVFGLPNGQEIKIRASSPQGLEIPESGVSPDVDGTIIFEPEIVSELVDSVKYHNSEDVNSAFAIDWEINIGAGGWLEMGSTKHTVYITLDDPNTDLRQETLFEIGCRRANNETNVGIITTLIYAEFEKKEVKRVNGNLRLSYWKNSEAGAATTADLLSSLDGNGICNAWALFFRDVLRIQGIPANLVSIRPLIADTPDIEKALAVKEWNFAENGSADAPYIYVYQTEANPGNEGTVAQNNPNPPKLFKIHYLTLSQGVLYDPSYGTPAVTTTLKDYEDASFAGFGKFVELPDGQRKLAFRKNDTNGSSDSEVEINGIEGE